jgi:hypothetical protein
MKQIPSANPNKTYVTTQKAWHIRCIDESFGLSLFINDCVVVEVGEHASKQASVISIESMAPEQEYTVKDHSLYRVIKKM